VASSRRPSAARGRAALVGLVLALGVAAATGQAGATAAPQPPSAAPTPPPAAAPSTPPAPPGPRPPLLPAPGDAPVPTAAALTAVLERALADPGLGGRIAASVVDATTGQVLVERRGGATVLPASTAKIATAVAVLAALDPDLRLPTRVLAGARPGEVVLVGSGDVTLAGPSAQQDDPLRPARLADLARDARAALGGTRVRRVLVDDTAYAGPRLAPGWKPTYVTDGDAMPVSAVSVDAGRDAPGRGPRVQDPGLAAGRALAAALGAPGARVARGVAPQGAAELAAVRSPPVSRLVERLLVRSDNDLAESLSRQVALARQRPPTFAGASSAVGEVLAEVLPGTGGAGFALADGSGLSRSDRVQPAAVTALLSHVVRDGSGRYAPVLTGLPVAGFDGTLEDRFRAGTARPAAGVVRAKTGTLADVSALAGLVRTRDGRLLAFDVTADAVPSGANGPAEAALDRLAAGLASCGCR